MTDTAPTHDAAEDASDLDITSAHALIEQIQSLDPAQSPEPASELAEILGSLLEAEGDRA